jgi:GNAT superfamily N-acetyltransferase
VSVYAPGVLIRAFAEGDESAVAAVVDAAYGNDARLHAFKMSGHGEPLERPLRRTLLAFVDDAPAAVATRLHSPQEPPRTWIDIVVAPPFRRRGIGTALLEEIRGPARGALRTRATFADHAALGFLRARGFGLLDPSWDRRFDPREIVARLPEPRLDAPPSPDEAAAFFDRVQDDVHPFEPRIPRPPERARALFCGDGMVPDSLVGVRDAGGRLVAAANLVRPLGYDPGDELYLVWAGALETHAEAAEHVVSACIRFAADADMYLRFEAGGGNAPLLRALDRLGVLGEPVFGIFGDDADAYPDHAAGWSSWLRGPVGPVGTT